MDLAEQIKKVILEVVEDAQIYVHDPDSQHLEATVVSDTFKEKSLLERSKSIMTALKSYFETDLHALKLQTYTHEEWKTKDRL